MFRFSKVYYRNFKRVPETDCFYLLVCVYTVVNSTHVARLFRKKSHLDIFIFPLYSKDH